MTIRVAHWDTLDDSLAFGIQGEDIFECTNGKCHVFTFLYAKRKILLSIQMASVIVSMIGENRQLVTNELVEFDK